MAEAKEVNKKVEAAVGASSHSEKSAQRRKDGADALSTGSGSLNEERAGAVNPATNDEQRLQNEEYEVGVNHTNLLDILERNTDNDESNAELKESLSRYRLALCSIGAEQLLDPEQPTSEDIALLKAWRDTKFEPHLLSDIGIKALYMLAGAYLRTCDRMCSAMHLHFPCNADDDCPLSCNTKFMLNQCLAMFTSVKTVADVIKLETALVALGYKFAIMCTELVRDVTINDVDRYNVSHGLFDHMLSAYGYHGITPGIVNWHSDVVIILIKLHMARKIDQALDIGDYWHRVCKLYVRHPSEEINIERFDLDYYTGNADSLGSSIKSLSDIGEEDDVDDSGSDNRHVDDFDDDDDDGGEYKAMKTLANDPAQQEMLRAKPTIMTVVREFFEDEDQGGASKAPKADNAAKSTGTADASSSQTDRPPHLDDFVSDDDPSVTNAMRAASIDEQRKTGAVPKQKQAAQPKAKAKTPRRPPPTTFGDCLPKGGPIKVHQVTQAIKQQLAHEFRAQLKEDRQRMNADRKTFNQIRNQLKALKTVPYKLDPSKQYYTADIETIIADFGGKYADELKCLFYTSDMQLHGIPAANIVNRETRFPLTVLEALTESGFNEIDGVDIANPPDIIRRNVYFNNKGRPYHNATAKGPIKVEQMSKWVAQLWRQYAKESGLQAVPAKWSMKQLVGHLLTFGDLNKERKNEAREAERKRREEGSTRIKYRGYVGVLGGAEFEKHKQLLEYKNYLDKRAAQRTIEEEEQSFLFGPSVSMSLASPAKQLERHTYGKQKAHNYHKLADSYSCPRAEDDPLTREQDNPFGIDHREEEPWSDSDYSDDINGDAESFFDAADAGPDPINDPNKQHTGTHSVTGKDQIDVKTSIYSKDLGASNVFVNAHKYLLDNGDLIMRNKHNIMFAAQVFGPTDIQPVKTQLYKAGFKRFVLKSLKLQPTEIVYTQASPAAELNWDKLAGGYLGENSTNRIIDQRNMAKLIQDATQMPRLLAEGLAAYMKHHTLRGDYATLYTRMSMVEMAHVDFVHSDYKVDYRMPEAGGVRIVNYKTDTQAQIGPLINTLKAVLDSGDMVVLGDRLSDDELFALRVVAAGSQCMLTEAHNDYQHVGETFKWPPMNIVVLNNGDRELPLARNLSPAAFVGLRAELETWFKESGVGVRGYTRAALMLNGCVKTKLGPNGDTARFFTSTLECGKIKLPTPKFHNFIWTWGNFDTQEIAECPFKNDAAALLNGNSSDNNMAGAVVAAQASVSMSTALHKLSFTGRALNNFRKGGNTRSRIFSYLYDLVRIKGNTFAKIWQMMRTTMKALFGSWFANAVFLDQNYNAEFEMLNADTPNSDYYQGAFGHSVPYIIHPLSISWSLLGWAPSWGIYAPPVGFDVKADMHIHNSGDGPGIYCHLGEENWETDCVKKDHWNLDRPYGITLLNAICQHYNIPANKEVKVRFIEWERTTTKALRTTNKTRAFKVTRDVGMLHCQIGQIVTYDWVNDCWYSLVIPIDILPEHAKRGLKYKPVENSVYAGITRPFAEIGVEIHGTAGQMAGWEDEPTGLPATAEFRASEPNHAPTALGQALMNEVDNTITTGTDLHQENAAVTPAGNSSGPSSERAQTACRCRLACMSALLAIILYI